MPPSSVSVVIPLYNKAPYVERALRSVLAQSFRDFEVVVVDDGSTDESASIVRRVDDARIRLIRQSNGGESSARNRGIRESNGELIAFLDADDNYNPEFLSVISDLAARHESAGAYGTSFEIIGTGRQVSVSRTVSLRRSGKRDVLIRDYCREALSGFVLCSSSVAVPKRTFAEVGMFREGVRLGEDLDMWLRIGVRFPIAVSSYVGAVYHKEAANRVDDGRTKGFEYELVRSGLRLLASAPLERKRKGHLREYVSMHQLMTGAQMVLDGRPGEARGVLRLCRTRRFLFSKLWWQFWSLLPPWAAFGAQRIKRRVLGAS